MEIQVTEKYKVIKIPHNYQLVEYVEGGKKTRNPKTGEETITESGWQNRNVFYANLPAMIKYIARIESDENATDLNDWLARFEQVLNSFEVKNG